MNVKSADDNSERGGGAGAVSQSEAGVASPSGLLLLLHRLKRPLFIQSVALKEEEEEEEEEEGEEEEEKEREEQQPREEREME
ncbi:hypothetical protein EYF80_058979 [Liparis tanakae]|uniref:Uncharacterized protein n=1 Tax=Liparis tanakae TaxID=230148 RepID=A0A4Z2EPZ5_9TELE|nr:hypothetical protein EYF80_058979 [Liparis tanakae]